MPMREYTCAPIHRSRRAYLSVLGCVLFAVALWTVPGLFSLSHRPLWLCASLFALTAALLITTRYLVRRYVYRLIAREDGGFDFVVLEISGKRTVCVCRVSTDSFRTITREEKGKRVRPTYDWSTDLGARGYLLTLTDGEGRFFEEGEEITVRFSPDREMAAMIEYSLRPMI